MRKQLHFCYKASGDYICAPRLINYSTLFSLKVILVIAIFAATASAGLAGPQHQSSLNFSSGGQGRISQKITIGLNKSVIVDLPKDVRDVMVSHPQFVDAVIQSSRRAYLIGMAEGQTNVFFFDNSGQQMVTLEIIVQKDLQPLLDLFKEFIPDSNLKARMVEGNILVSGSVGLPVDANRAKDLAQQFVGGNGKVLNMISVSSNEQVMLKVKIVEINRSAVKRLGVNLSGVVAGDVNAAFNTNNRFPLSAGNGVDSLFYGVFGKDPASCIASTALRGANMFNSIFPELAAGQSINCLAPAIEAFERTGVLRTLAQPNLTAISGESASFLAGGEFPIPVAEDDGISVEFKPFGVGLSFVPVVLSPGRISLQVSTEVSDISQANSITAGLVSIPGLSVRRAKTQVELPSGGSLVIGGLLSDELRQSIEGTPGLKDLPILGKLFRSKDFIRSETELMVIITPYLVKSVATSELTQPDAGFSPASQRDGILMGRINRVYGNGSKPLTAGGYKGEYGYIVD